MRRMKQRHLERVHWSPSPAQPRVLSTWPYTIPAVEQIVREGGLDIGEGVTFLVGENGSGKSTVVEAFAAIHPRSGFVNRFVPVAGPDSSSEDSPLPFSSSRKDA